VNAERIGQLLPGVFQRTLRAGGPLAALLEVMENMHSPAENALEHFDTLLDPWRTPDRFVPMLARWVDLERIIESRLEGNNAALHQLMPTGLGRLRALIASAAYLSRWRGTRKGLLLFLQIATGLADFDIDEQVMEEGKPRPFHLRVTAPEAAEPHRKLIEQIIESERPAHVTYELKFRSP
jgi:phage tail-like protein